MEYPSVKIGYLEDPLDEILVIFYIDASQHIFEWNRALNSK